MHSALGRSLWLSARAHCCWSHRRQWLARRPSSCKNRRRAVPLVNIAIDRHGGTNLVIALHASNGHCHVMNHAEPFAVVGECVMESSTDVDGDAVVESVIGCQNRSPRSKPEGPNQLRRVGYLEF